MKEVLKQFTEKISPNCRDEEGENHAYAIFRIVVAVMFFAHGLQKMFGLFGGVDGAGASVVFGNLFWFAGLIEIVVGALVFLGIYTRMAALVGLVEMLVAYFVVHLASGLIPLLNGGELAIMYLVSFLVIFRYGGGKWSLEKRLSGGEWF